MEIYFYRVLQSVVDWDFDKLPQPILDLQFFQETSRMSNTNGLYTQRKVENRIWLLQPFNIYHIPIMVSARIYIINVKISEKISVGEIKPNTLKFNIK